MHMKGEKGKMLSMIRVIILSYVNKYGCVDLNEIRNVVNEPIGLIAREVISLYSDGYLKRREKRYELTEKALLEDVSLWNVWIDDKDSDESFLVEENLQPRVNDIGIPHFSSANDLYNILKLEHIDLNAYHVFNISKGYKERIITAPSKNLKVRQRWILEFILNKISLPECVHGFVGNKSIVTNANCHVNKKEIGCLDIKDFFPSVSYEQIFKVFKEMGYCDEVVKVLCMLCTYEGILPQGAPTSPMLANIVFKPVDLEILGYAEKNMLTYSRYADDITISADTSIEDHLDEIKKRIEKYGFEINESKTHIMKDNYRKVVTGLIVSDKVKVPQKYKRKFRQEIYYCRKFGVEQHLKNIGRTSAVNFKEYMYGKAYFIKMVEEDVGEAFLKQLDEIFSIQN